MTEYLVFGEPVIESDGASPTAIADRVVSACEASVAFTVLERRHWSASDVGSCDVIIVDCINDQVATRNGPGLRPRERLALVLPRDASRLPQVRTLRKDFPLLMHMNHVSTDEPASLCLYFEPWSHVRRTWTPERFLQRILFWLTESARGTLHRADQPVEAMYFEFPFDVVLPPDWDDLLNQSSHMLLLKQVQRNDERCTIRSAIILRDKIDPNRPFETVAIRVRVNTVVHGRIEQPPATLGDLSDGIDARGASLLDPLRAEITRIVGALGMAKSDGQRCLILVSVPTKRPGQEIAERVDIRGFYVPLDLATLGVAVGALSEVPAGEKYYTATIVGGSRDMAPVGTVWRDTPISPVAIRHAVTREFARKASSVPEDGADDKRLLAGLGALGSQLADLWAREGWGAWTLVDHDFVQPHNVIRHVARDEHIGYEKVDVINHLLQSIRPSERNMFVPFKGDVLTTSNAAFIDDMKQVRLIVDATTTLEVPRELSHREEISRCVSVFLTPSGGASVMLLEDEERGIRLDELEAQYYGSLLSCNWGIDHLTGHQGGLWVGAGCRDISAVLSNEVVQLHASILARQVRILSALPPAEIRIWHADHDVSTVSMTKVAVYQPFHQMCDDWTVVSHSGISEKLNTLRYVHLPAETGGIIVGYIDHPLKRIFVVDVLPAPSDSEGTPSGFIRGTDGLVEKLATIKDRTAGIVGYLGEWHSHPPFHTPRPSPDDFKLLEHCATTLESDGVPALMIIVGSACEISCLLGMRESVSS